MKRWCLTLVCLTICASSAQAGVMIRPAPGPTRIDKSDAVIVGKVDRIEPEDVKVGETMYRIAVVKVNDAIKGAKDAKTLRIGFVPTPDGRPKIIRPGFRPIQLQVGQEGIFLLAKNAKGDFYTIGGQAGFYINSENNKDFDKEVQIAKTTVKVLNKPMDALEAKNAEERLIAAAVFIDKYRTFRGPRAAQEPINAEESKLILQALANADWKTQVNSTSLRPSAQQLFQRLGVTATDGFMVPMGGDYQTVAQAWCRDNAAKYRIQRYVAK